MKYEKRVVAYLDILGFKTLLNETTNKDSTKSEEAIDQIISAYDSIREILDIGNPSGRIGKQIKSTKMVSTFSDCIAISFAIQQPDEVFYTLYQIQHLIMSLLQHKILCRGAVAMGQLLHTESYLFGPALVEAYLLESKAAIYPRVILDRSIIENAKHTSSFNGNRVAEGEIIESLLGRDSDGMYYVDYFSNVEQELDDPIYDFPQYIQLLEGVIRKGLQGSRQPSKADIRVKYCWMREKFNEMVEQVTMPEALDLLNRNGETETLAYYQSLRKISPRKGWYLA